MPYTFLPQENKTIHLPSIPRATQYLKNKIPDLVIISASYSPPQVFQLLETLKECSQARLYLTPLLFFIDLDHKNSFIPGTYWGNKLGLINSLSSKEEVKLILTRICQPQKRFGY